MADQLCPAAYSVLTRSEWRLEKLIEIKRVARLRAAFARQVAMYLAHVAWGLSLTEVGQVFARDRTTVAHACGRVEDLRDDADFDRSLELLEGVLLALSESSVPLADQLRVGL